MCFQTEVWRRVQAGRSTPHCGIPTTNMVEREKSSLVTAMPRQVIFTNQPVIVTKKEGFFRILSKFQGKIETKNP